jgi:hypothetical protein
MVRFFLRIGLYYVMKLIAGAGQRGQRIDRNYFRYTEKRDSLRCPGFGTFEVRDRAARTGRNPKAGEELKIAASRVAAFKPSAALKAAVNGGGKTD